jgi:serine/threonine protein kinase
MDEDSIIGKGTEGVVHENPNDKKKVFKTFEVTDQGIPRSFVNEIQIGNILKLRTKNVPNSKSYFLTPISHKISAKNCCIEYPRYTCNLEEFLRSIIPSRYEDDDCYEDYDCESQSREISNWYIFQIFDDLIKAVSFLNLNCNILHLDIKPANILLHFEFHEIPLLPTNVDEMEAFEYPELLKVTLCDWGMAVMGNYPNQIANSKCFRPVELGGDDDNCLGGYQYIDHKTDIFALGITMAYYWLKDYDYCTLSEIMELIPDAVKEMNLYFSGLGDLVQNMTSNSYFHRFNWKDVLEHWKKINPENQKIRSQIDDHPIPKKPRNNKNENINKSKLSFMTIDTQKGVHSTKKDSRFWKEFEDLIESNPNSKYNAKLSRWFDDLYEDYPELDKWHSIITKLISDLMLIMPIDQEFDDLVLKVFPKIGSSLNLLYEKDLADLYKIFQIAKDRIDYQIPNIVDLISCYKPKPHVNAQNSIIKMTRRILEHIYLVAHSQSFDIGKIEFFGFKALFIASFIISVKIWDRGVPHIDTVIQSFDLSYHQQLNKSFRKLVLKAEIFILNNINLPLIP